MFFFFFPEKYLCICGEWIKNIDPRLFSCTFHYVFLAFFSLVGETFFSTCTAKIYARKS